MPELPDVELYRRVIDKSALARPIARVVVLDARILGDTDQGTFELTLSGNSLEETRRHGKHLLARLRRGGWLALHFGMTGAPEPYDGGNDPPRYERVRLEFGDGGRLAYTSRRMLGRVGLAADADSFIAAHDLGPDALDPAFDAEALSRLLERRRTDVKAVLMDQSAVAGIGNIYADEILFRARMHPRTRADSLDRPAAERLHRAMREVLETAIRSGAGAEQFLERLPGDYLLPHRKAGARCPVCGGEVRSIKSGGRTTYFCPRCQPEGKGAAA